MAPEPLPAVTTWEVLDPKGMTHIIIKSAETDWAGHENLTHHHDDHMERPYVLSMLLWQLEKHPDMGEWGGYAWMRR